MRRNANEDMFCEIKRKACLDSLQGNSERKRRDKRVHCSVATENIDKHRSNTFLGRHSQEKDNKKKKKKKKQTSAGERSTNGRVRSVKFSASVIRASR